jgi:glycosyltransferase 2 family protein
LSIAPGALVLFLAVAALGIAVLRSKRLSLLAERALLKLPLLDRLAPHLEGFHASSNDLLSSRPLVVGTVISFLSWGLECLAVYLCAVGLGTDMSFLLVVFVFAVSSLIGVVSMLPGGIGAVEAGLYGQFVTVAGLPAGQAAALTVIIRLATLWFATLVGIVGLFAVRMILGDASIKPEP